MSTPDIIARAEHFIWLHGRLLDRHLFACLFRGGPRAPVLAALRAYQNDDGGFGNGLEPDIRAPISQPVPTEMALRLLDLVGLEAEMVGRLCDYLPTITTTEGGVPFVLPSVRAYPRAPWWETADNPPASVNPTASIAGLLHRFGVRHPWLDRATALCWSAIEAGRAHEVHELLAVMLFLEHVPERERAEQVFARLGEQILTSGLVALDPDAPGYVKKPLEWAPRPNSLCRRLFDDATIARHLDRLQAEQREDGGWPIAWPVLSPAIEAEWRGWETIRALLTLRAYGRLG